MPLDIRKLAYCGLYCDQCSFKTAYEEQNIRHLEGIPYQFTLRGLSEYNCGCCKGYCICGPCKIKPCASQKGIGSCAECGEFPCDIIVAFADDGMPHHRRAFENLRDIRERGVEKWFEDLEPKLTCHCGQRQTWYYACPEHGE